MFAMVGARVNHNRISSNITTELNNKFKANQSPCDVFSSDMRVKIQESSIYTYPDIVAICGDIELEDHHFDTLLNPVVIIEILSSSTEAYDRGQKFTHYRRITSLQEYILVSQYHCQVEKYVRRDDGTWSLSSYEGMEEKLNIASIHCELRLSDIYYRVEFER
ncbi:conserved hypothetical protein [Desulfamplus magnetovallimortis]|uniref:Putative restriction endonuclease domain-containing protein n=2 Tax=Desulfamplus magnetovallimortis TaxID=1246637 RepID=A0A1W1HGP9_9BACT|nr:Uma2 family endonuclease [Desulfamplus magnetovallimortis]SLM31603.1 conserved hypothetical protein [Desulfamplus magnetovallimortis]